MLFTRKNFIAASVAVTAIALFLIWRFIYDERRVNSTPFLDAGFNQADLSLRVGDYPQTYISRIDIDLTGPQHYVRLSWSGPLAHQQEQGPFHSSPGRGWGENNCDEFAESNRNGSLCTPKGSFRVEGFNDCLPSLPKCRFVTWFNLPREIALHSHWDLPTYPASHGCVRLDSHAAQLVHNNSIFGKTQVIVDGTWTRGR
jgi:hypothetical protein